MQAHKQLSPRLQPPCLTGTRPASLCRHQAIGDGPPPPSQQYAAASYAKTTQVWGDVSLFCLCLGLITFFAVNTTHCLLLGQQQPLYLAAQSMPASLWPPLPPMNLMRKMPSWLMAGLIVNEIFSKNNFADGQGGPCPSKNKCGHVSSRTSPPCPEDHPPARLF